MLHSAFTPVIPFGRDGGGGHFPSMTSKQGVAPPGSMGWKPAPHPVAVRLSHCKWLDLHSQLHGHPTDEETEQRGEVTSPCHKADGK